MKLLERDGPLAVLGEALEAARARGQLVSIAGEAGVGKTALLQAFAATLGADARVSWGHCEALGTPRPLGPLADMAPMLGGATERALDSGAPRHRVFAACLADLAAAPRTSVLVFEDVHWADEATLDLVQHLGNRLGSTPALIVVSWRDEEAGADHGIHRVFGGWPRRAVRRVALAPLSVESVGRLAGRARDARALHALTGGNPFFVTEIAEQQGDEVPASVRDAVLARRSRLDPAARDIVDLVSVVPARTELDLVDSLLAPPPGVLERCEQAGLLTCSQRFVAFRHELARLAVVEALPASRVRHLHQRVRRALDDRPDRDHVLPRIVHHAEASGDVPAILASGPAAARQAAALGAHHEAADHYRRTLAHADAAPEAVRAELTEALAYERYLTSDMQAAQDARRAALTLWTRLGDGVAVGRNVRWLSRLAWFLGDGAEAARQADAAIALLEPLPPGVELAMAYSNRSQLDMLGDDEASCIAWGGRAIALARALDARDVLSHALNNVGAARLCAGDRAGRGELEESLRLALADDLHEHAARAYTNLASTSIGIGDYAYARQWLDPGIAYCLERDLDAWRLYLLGWRARLGLETGDWAQACDDAEAVLASATAAVSRIPALAAIGLVRVRRGDPGALAVLDEALALARPTGEAQRLVPVLIARAELAMQTGRRDEAVDALEEGVAAQEGSHASHAADRLVFLRWRLDGGRPRAVADDGPYRRLMDGDWQGAAQFWRQAGCPFEEAEALAEGDEGAVRQALDMFLRLGAAPAVDRARQRLRHLGVTAVPRGRRPSTRSHPAGLTVREAEILALLGERCSNAAIATRLFVSPKTVEHHVSSILAKLDAPTRDAAVERARQAGWIP
ncbi:MAG: AAA family ATPase [Vicinamibacterales bacterium]